MSRARGIYRGFARFLTALILTLMALGFVIPASGAQNDPAGGTGLHDEAGVFSDQERARIEQAIQDVEAAGAPTVVYLHLLQTEDDRAVRDAKRLMESWDVQSSEDARDGVVMYFNLNPDDPNRGEFGVVAGEAHYDDGALPQSRLDNIRDDMIELLADDRMAEAIVLGLEMTADYLESGPPEPTAFETFIDRIASGPFSLVNALGLVAAIVLAAIGWPAWRDRPQAGHVYEVQTTEPPSDLHPALAGALVQANVNHSQVEALMLDLSQNGAIALEPDDTDEKKVRVRILNQRRAFNDYELELLTILAEEAGEDQILDQTALAKTQTRWGDVQDLIRGDLEQSGWFDPQAGEHRRPLWISGSLALLVAAAVAFVPISVLEEPWTLISGGPLALLGAVFIGMSASYPRTTVDGEREAVPWRGYSNGLKNAAKDDYGGIDLDEAFPYIVSMGLTSDFHKHLEKASEAGYVPAWMVAADHQRQAVSSNWFIYWTSFHHSMNYSPSGGGTGAGGAAAGSGGAGGRF